MDVDMEMRDLIDRYNRTKIAELELESGLKWLGDTGPVYRCGPYAIKALFVDSDGKHWGDAEMALESRWPDQPDVRECMSEQFSGGDDPIHELWIHTIWRGRHAAFIVPITDIADVLDLEDPQLSTDSWARMWGTMPQISDGHERELVALGATELVAGVW